MSAEPVVLVDDPAPHVRRVTLNRPEKRNALNHDLRGGILSALEAADADPDVHVMIVRGAGKLFLVRLRPGRWQRRAGFPVLHAPAGEGQWPRHVTWKAGCASGSSGSP